ncbi:MAG: PAS domain S-box protein [Candidatus Obscuribacterales bacterium]|nr:PAS domain S-box protein [Candidatus Obscuribacterales bacterium]
MTNSDKPATPLTYEELSELVKRHESVIKTLKTTLSVQQSKTRDILYSIPLGLLVVNGQQRIEALNKLIEEFFGYQTEELVSKKITELFPDLQFLRVNPKPVPVMARRKGGETFPAEIIVNEFDAQLNFVHVQDITERSRLDRLRQDFVAMVSHDLRTPLTSIRGFLTMASEGAYGPVSDQGNRAIDRAQSSADLLISLVVDLLDAEKIDSGEFEPDLQETTTNVVVDRAIYASQAAAKGANVEIDKEVTNDVFWADEDRVVQVIVNLVGNAIKFSPAGSIVTISAGLEGAGVVFRIKDRGPGIPKQLQSAIFERYRQLNQPKETKRRGFGLGLAICKSLVEKHKGRIWVQSEEGKGSTFCFSIPLMDENFRT